MAGQSHSHYCDFTVRKRCKRNEGILSDAAMLVLLMLCWQKSLKEPDLMLQSSNLFYLALV